MCSRYKLWSSSSQSLPLSKECSIRGSRGLGRLAPAAVLFFPQSRINAMVWSGDGSIRVPATNVWFRCFAMEAGREDVSPSPLNNHVWPEWST